MVNRSCLLLMLLLVALCACEPPRTNPDLSPRGEEEAAPSAPVAPVQPVRHQLDTGDVEQTVWAAGKLAENFRDPSVTEELLRNGRGEITMSTITVAPPYPATLPVRFGFRIQGNYREDPVVIRGQVKADETPIGSFTTIVGAREQQYTWDFDVMALLDPIPDSVLLVSVSEAHLMPHGTDPESLDPATATASKENQTVLYSNPVRIDFVKETAPEPAAE